MGVSPACRYSDGNLLHSCRLTPLLVVRYPEFNGQFPRPCLVRRIRGWDGGNFPAGGGSSIPVPVGSPAGDGWMPPGRSPGDATSAPSGMRPRHLRRSRPAERAPPPYRLAARRSVPLLPPVRWRGAATPSALPKQLASRLLSPWCVISV